MQTILVLQPWNFTQSTTYIIMWVNFTHDSTVLNPFWSIMATSNAWARINPASEGVWKTLKKKWFLKEFQIFRKGLGFRTRIYYSFHDLSISLALLFFFSFPSHESLAPNFWSPKSEPIKLKQKWISAGKTLRQACMTKRCGPSIS